MPRDFRKLIAWKKADDLVVEIYRSSAVNFPRDERYGLTQQVRRCAASVPSNLAEGCGRRTEDEFRQFLYMARASIYEVEYQLHLAARLGYLPETEYLRLEALRNEAGKVLTGLIRHVEVQIKDRKLGRNKQPPRPDP